MTPAEHQQLLQLKPRLSPGLKASVHKARGDRSIVLHNSISGEYTQVSPATWQLLVLFDGCRTLGDIAAQKPDLMPASPEAQLQLFVELAQTRLIESGSEALAVRLGSMQEKPPWYKQNPLAVRVPLHDPDEWLGKVADWLAGVSLRWTLRLCSLLLLAAAFGLLLNWQAMTHEFSQLANSPQRWWLYGLIYPFLKACHELGHALAIKRYGGHVHEIGMTFLVFVPVPYVDASDAWQLVNKHQRIVVSAAGIAVELCCAALGLLVWLLVEPGVVKNAAFALALLGSLSTVIFNANPLMRFDGYYIAQDWLAIPNLSRRATRYCLYLIKRHILRAAVQPPHGVASERGWLMSYGVLATMYRLIIMLIIAFWLIEHVPLVGVVLAAWAVWKSILAPLVKTIRYLAASHELNAHRRAAVVGVGATLVFLFVVVMALPLPHSTRATGIVWVPEQAEVYASESGVVQEVMVNAGEWVSKGQPLWRQHAPLLDAERQRLQARHAALRAERLAALEQDALRAAQLLADLDVIQEELDRLTIRSELMVFRAPLDGRIAFTDRQPLAGRWLKAGEAVGYLVDPDQLIVRAVVDQDDVGQVRAGIKDVSVRLAERSDQRLDATLLRETPAGSFTLPSLALADTGYGGIAIARQADNSVRTTEQVFHLELNLPAQVAVAGIGERAFVTLTHAPTALGARWLKSARQLLLRRLSV